MKETIKSLKKLVNSWRDAATSYNHHGEYVAGYSFYTCAKELEEVIKNTSEVDMPDIIIPGHLRKIFKSHMHNYLSLLGWYHPDIRENILEELTEEGIEFFRILEGNNRF